MDPASGELLGGLVLADPGHRDRLDRPALAALAVERPALTASGALGLGLVRAGAARRLLRPGGPRDRRRGEALRAQERAELGDSGGRVQVGQFRAPADAGGRADRST